MKPFLEFIKANWLFSIIVLIIIGIIFKLNGLSGGLKYLILMFCVTFPVIFMQGLIANFRKSKATKAEEHPGGDQSMTDASKTYAEALDAPKSLAQAMIPYGIGAGLFLLLFLLALNGGEKVFTLTYAAVFLLCILFYETVLAIFRKLVKG